MVESDLKMDSELRVEDTNSEALVAKISAAKLGYLKDPFASCFVSGDSKKEVLINRGYWSRVFAVRMYTEEFFKAYAPGKVQVISVGAGLDTLYFNLKSEKVADFANVTYVELDLPSVVKKKARTVNRSKALSALVSNNAQDKIELAEDNSSLLGPDYKLLSVDLRDEKQITAALERAGIDYKVPTFVFAECVLAYLPAKQSDQAIQFFSVNFEKVYFLNYEMMFLNDQFGKMMVKNFKAKGIDLVGINDYPNIPSLQKRFTELGYTSVEVYDMIDMYNVHLDQTERKRIEKIEWFDEFEEWNLMQKHYYVSLCSKGEEIPKVVINKEAKQEAAIKKDVQA